MGRVIASRSLSSNGKTVNVTPEAINRFCVDPVDLHSCDDSSDCLSLRVDIEADVHDAAPVTITLTDAETDKKLTEACDEKAFAESMLDAIVTKHGDINNVKMLKDTCDKLAAAMAYDIWQKEGKVYTHLSVPGFGFIEAGNDVVAVTDHVKYDESGVFYATDCTYLSTFENMGKGHLHFLPKGTDRFLVFDLSVAAASDNLSDDGKRCSFMLNTEKWPAPSKEVPVGKVPGLRTEYETEDDYLCAVTSYLQDHMSAGNDRRIELEDDLIF